MITEAKHLGKLLLKPSYRKHYSELKKLNNTPRYTSTSTNLLGRKIEVVDSASFLFMYKEIFEQQIYKFKTQKSNPVIIDGGANIGLSILYFKQIFPDSLIVAFEPDKKVFFTLSKNIESYGITNINLVNKALWSSETTLKFMAEGADGGRAVQLQEEIETYTIPTVRLRDYLHQPVDFLKLDIEGAETEVIKDCQDLLGNVSNLFVEYHSFVNQPQDLHTLLNILAEKGFRLHIHPPVTSPQPFYHRNVHLGMDMQLNIFAFRE